MIIIIIVIMCVHSLMSEYMDYSDGKIYMRHTKKRREKKCPFSFHLNT